MTQIVILSAQISHGVRCARTIFQWKIVSIERPIRKDRAGQARGVKPPAASPLTALKKPDNPRGNRRAVCHPHQ